MSSVFASRRRAEEFNSLVEAPAAGAGRDARLEEFLAVVEGLRAVPDPEPRPEFVTSLRAELMSAADTLLVPAEADRLTLPPRTASRDRRLAAAIGGFAVVGATASMAVAAQSALPGEMLYPLKRAIEDGRVSLTSAPEAKALSLLDSASSRLDEVAELSREGELSDEGGMVSANIDDFGRQASEAADLLLAEYAESGEADLVRELRDFTAESMTTLELLEAQVPESARDELLDAAALVSEIDARAEQACPSCGGAGVGEIPPVLLASAGEVTDSSVVVVPGTVVDEPGRDSRSGRDGRDGRTGQGRGGQRDGTTGGNATGGATVVPDDLVTAPGGGGGDGSGGTTPDNPLGALTDALPEPEAPAAGGGGTKKKPDDTVKDTVGGVGGQIDDEVGETIDETVDDVIDPLLGD